MEIKEEEPLIVRFSTVDDADALVAFYEPADRRTKNVFKRHEKLIRSLAERGRYVTVWRDDILLAATALIDLNNGAPFAFCKIPDKQPEIGRIVELASVLRIGEAESEKNKGYPRGGFTGLLMSLTLVAALEPDKSFDAIIVEILRTATNCQKFVTGEWETGSPLEFALIDNCVTQELIEAFSTTTDDVNQNNRKNFYRVFVHNNLVPAAKALKKIIKGGALVDTRPPSVDGYKRNMRTPVDLSQIELYVKGTKTRRGGYILLEDLLDVIIENEDFFARFESHHKISWKEVTRQFNAFIPSSKLSRSPRVSTARRPSNDNEESAGVRTTANCATLSV